MLFVQKSFALIISIYAGSIRNVMLITAIVWTQRSLCLLQTYHSQWHNQRSKIRNEARARANVKDNSSKKLRLIQNISYRSKNFRKFWLTDEISFYSLSTWSKRIIITDITNLWRKQIEWWNVAQKWSDKIWCSL